jgi:hypothetical protein
MQIHPKTPEFRRPLPAPKIKWRKGADASGWVQSRDFWVANRLLPAVSFVHLVVKNCSRGKLVYEHT